LSVIRAIHFIGAKIIRDEIIAKGIRNEIVVKREAIGGNR